MYSTVPRVTAIQKFGNLKDEKFILGPALEPELREIPQTQNASSLIFAVIPHW
jgi:hypothetical protein